MNGENIRVILGLGGQAKDVPWGLNRKAAEVVQDHGEAGKSYAVLSLVELADMVHPGTTVVLVEEELFGFPTGRLDTMPTDVAHDDDAAAAVEVLDQAVAEAAEGGAERVDAPVQEESPAEAGTGAGVEAKGDVSPADGAPEADAPAPDETVPAEADVGLAEEPAAGTGEEEATATVQEGEVVKTGEGAVDSADASEVEPEAPEVGKQAPAGSAPSA